MAFRQKSSLDAFVDESAITCARTTCYGKMVKILSQDGDVNVCWDCDGPNGPDMEPNSLSVLIMWWMTEGNYVAYRGGKNHGGKTKDGYWAELSLRIKDMGIKVDRSPALIGAKIQCMEDQYRSASDWLMNTGEGCLEHGEDVATYMKKLCPFFYEIDEVMCDCASV